MASPFTTDHPDTTPSDELAFLDQMSHGELAVLLERAHQTLAARLADPDSYQRYARWSQPAVDSAADYNTVLATEPTRGASNGSDIQLDAPENLHDTLPWMNKSLERCVALVEQSRNLLMAHTLNALDIDRQTVLGIPWPEDHFLNRCSYMCEVLNITRREYNQLVRRAELVAPRQPGEEPEMALLAEVLQETEMPEDHRDPHASASPYMNAEGERINDQERAFRRGGLGEAGEKLNYGLSMTNADLIMQYYRQLNDYAIDSNADPERADAALKIIERDLIIQGRRMNAVALRRYFEMNRFRYETLIDEDGPEPVEDLPKKPEKFQMSDIPGGGVELHLRAYGVKAEALRALRDAGWRLANGRGHHEQLTPEIFTEPEDSSESGAWKSVEGINYSVLLTHMALMAETTLAEVSELMPRELPETVIELVEAMKVAGNALDLHLVQLKVALSRARGEYDEAARPEFDDPHAGEGSVTREELDEFRDDLAEHFTVADIEDDAAETEEGERLTGKNLFIPTDSRSVPQVILDVFVHAIMAAYRYGPDSGIPRSRGVNTTLVALMDFDTLRDQALSLRSYHKSPPDDSSSDPPPGGQGELPVYVPQKPWEETFRSELLHTGVIKPHKLRQLLCDAQIIPAIFDGKSQILDLGRARRTYKFSQYLALLATQVGCTVPGCTVHGSLCDVHHGMTEWQHGGETNMDNAALVCPRHHREIHQGLWRIVRIDKETGDVWYNRPRWFLYQDKAMRNVVWDGRRTTRSYTTSDHLASGSNDTAA